MVHGANQTRRGEYQRLSRVEDESEPSDEHGSDSDAEFVKIKPTWLPKCLYTSSWGVPWEVKDIMREKTQNPDKSKGEHGDKLTMFDVSGPAVKWLWIATAIHWPFALVLPLAAYDFTDCNGLGMPRYRVWLWGLAFPVLATMVGIEWKCFTYTVTPLVQWLGHMSSPFGSTFPGWLIWHLGVSVVSSADVVAQGLWLASTFRWFQCPGWSDVAHAWTEVWGYSLFSWLTAGNDLKKILLVTWALCLAQLPLFVLSAFPLRFFGGDSVEFGLRSEKDGYDVLTCWPSLHIHGEDGDEAHFPQVEFKFAKAWHADALKALATLNRMSLLNAGLSRLQIERAELELTSGNAERCSQILLQELRLLIPRIFLINFFQNCTKLEVQTTIFSLGRMVSSSMNWQCLFCILLSHANAFYDLCLILDKAWKIRAQEQQCRTQANAASPSSHPPKSANRETINFLIYFVWIAGALCIFVQLHSAAKLVGAFVCQDSVWNFPNRCPDVKKYL